MPKSARACDARWTCPRGLGHGARQNMAPNRLVNFGVSMNDLTHLAALELRDSIAAGKVSAVEAAQAYLDAIGKFEPRLQAYNEVLAERAIRVATDLDAK